MPLPKAMWLLRVRSMIISFGDSKTSSSRFALPQQSTSLSPLRMVYVMQAGV